MKFKVGDIVEWCGIIGEVIGSDTSNTYLNVRFRHESGHVLDEVFYIDGLYRTYHKEPSLKLIEKSKKKVKKYKVLFKSLSTGDWLISYTYYKTLQEFDSNDIYKEKHLIEPTMIEVEE